MTLSLSLNSGDYLPRSLSAIHTWKKRMGEAHQEQQGSTNQSICLRRCRHSTHSKGEMWSNVGQDAFICNAGHAADKSGPTATALLKHHCALIAMEIIVLNAKKRIKDALDSVGTMVGFWPPFRRGKITLQLTLPSAHAMLKLSSGQFCMLFMLVNRSSLGLLGSYNSLIRH